MNIQAQPFKMVPLDSEMIESVGFVEATHCMFIKFKDGKTVCLEKVPRFRLQGLLAAPRKDAYYKSFIQNQFLSKPVEMTS
jgi:hypothetical protein